MAKKSGSFCWNVYLRPNPLKGLDGEGYIAELKTSSPVRHNEDVADLIVKERSEFRLETILHILKLRDQMVMRFIGEGACFADGVCRIAPRVSGPWQNEEKAFNALVHECKTDMTSSRPLKNMLKNVKVRVLGIKKESAYITEITDTSTGLKGGAMTIGDDIMISGEKLKVDETDALQGVFFRLADGTEFKTVRRFSLNTPKKLIVRLPPNLPEGLLTLIVRTKFTVGSERLKKIREIVCPFPCKALNMTP